MFDGQWVGSTIKSSVNSQWWLNTSVNPLHGSISIRNNYLPTLTTCLALRTHSSPQPKEHNKRTYTAQVLHARKRLISTRLNAILIYTHGLFCTYCPCSWGLKSLMPDRPAPYQRQADRWWRVPTPSEAYRLSTFAPSDPGKAACGLIYCLVDRTTDWLMAHKLLIPT